jgi:hypothetical protein
MRTKEAKDFLVQQTAEQAALEVISLSDLEKRMMYFVENDPISCADPLELNQEFEEKCDTEEYETKIVSLLHHAYKRLKSEDSDKARQWDLAIRTLSGGDHYLPVLWNSRPSSGYPLRGSFTPVRNSFTLLMTGLLVATGVAVAAFLTAKYNINLDRFRKYLPAPTPRLEVALCIGFVLLAVGGFYLFNWVLVAWLERKAKNDRDPR